MGLPLSAQREQRHQHRGTCDIVGTGGFYFFTANPGGWTVTYSSGNFTIGAPWTANQSLSFTIRYSTSTPTIGAPAVVKDGITVHIQVKPNGMSSATSVGNWTASGVITVVATENSIINSFPSWEVPPDGPTDLSASSTNSSVTLSWLWTGTGSNLGAIPSFDVYRTLDGNDQKTYQYIGSSNTFSFVDTLVPTGATYYYYVAAKTLDGRSFMAQVIVSR